MARNRSIGVALTVAAVVLAFAALVAWVWSDSTVDDRQMRANADAAFAGRTPDEVEPNRAPAIALGALSAVLFVSGTIYLAVSPSPELEPSDRQ